MKRIKRKKNPELVNIYRFSKDGFEPKYQDHLEDRIIDYLKLNKLNYPEHIRESLTKHKIIKDWKNYLIGIFVFIHEPDLRYREHLTNHIKNRKNYKWYKASISKDTLVFRDKDYILEENNLKIAGSIKYWDNVYIPIQNLKIFNVGLLDWDTEIDYNDPYYTDY